VWDLPEDVEVDRLMAGLRLSKPVTTTPQVCPHCGVSLADPSIPKHLQHAAGMFTLALSQDDQWLCPFCTGRWDRGQRKEDQRR
jgi:hypothetical protein